MFKISGAALFQRAGSGCHVVARLASHCPGRRACSVWWWRPTSRPHRLCRSSSQTGG